MQDHKTNIPYSCRQTLLKISREKDEEKKAEISRREREREDRRRKKERCQFKRDVGSKFVGLLLIDSMVVVLF